MAPVAPQRTRHLPAGGWLAACVAVAAAVAARDLAAERAVRPAAAESALWLADAPVDDGRRLLIVVDTATRHAALYHVETATGALTLRSSRDLTWDLMVDEFNAQEPKPAALRRLLGGGTGTAP